MSATIIVFGLSGVGKSHLIRCLIAAQDGFLHVQASALLKAAKARERDAAVDAEDLRRDKVIDNQELLLQEFSAIRKAEPRAIVFDGHNVIDTPTGLRKIPFDIISCLAPSGVVFVYDDPTMIVQRRFADTSRVRPQRTPEELCDHQDVSLRLALECTERLNVPFAKIRSGDLHGFASAINRCQGVRPRQA